MVVTPSPSGIALSTTLDDDASGSLAIYKLLFDHTSVGMFETTPDGRFVRANQRMAELLGYASPEDLINHVDDVGRSHYLEPQDRKVVIGRLARDGRIDRHVTRVRTRDGTPLWLRLSATAVQAQDGKTGCYVGTLEDITDLIETQQELERQKDDYDRLFENCAEGIYRSTPDGRMLNANPAQARLNGYDDPAELVARVNDIAREWYVEPNGREAFKSLIETHGRVRNLEAQIYRHKNRELAWIRENSWVVRDEAGEPLYYEGTITDITEEKKAIETIELSEGRQRDFAETTSDWFWETDAEHRFTYLSENARRFGIDESRVLGKRRIDWVEKFDRSPEEIAAMRENHAAMERQEPFREFIYRVRGRNRADEHVAIGGRPHYDETGAFLGYRGTCRIVTPQIKAAEDLRKARQTAEEASLAKSRFLANMSHELRTPLNAIIGFAEMMMRETFGPIGHERYREYMTDVHVSATMLLSLIEDILDISKAEAGRLDLDETVIDLAPELETVVQMLSPVAERRPVSLVVDLPPDRLGLYADVKRFRQIAINLATNAVKFSPADSVVRLAVREEAVVGLTLVVSDSGSGMSAADISRAMRPFEQLTDSCELANQGAGLGLPLCKEMAERHGATLDLTSTPGAGTTALVRFPAYRTRRLDPPEAASAGPVAAGVKAAG